MTDYDIVIIGGGINGCGIARDAAGRGLKVLLCEQNDLASATSSYSSKLIHGGLRYLEHYDFQLVRHALQERERLLSIAPHLIKPLKFIMPHSKDLRPAWLIRLGLFLYDHLATRTTLPASRTINLKDTPLGQPLQDQFFKGFSYYDCFADDARLVIANAKSARDLGAEIRVHSKCTNISPENNQWRIKLLMKNGSQQTIHTKSVVNAAGPWLNEIIQASEQQAHATHVKLIKGSHIITRKLYEGDHAYILQNHDQRIIFVIPYQEHFSLIGTTDVEYTGNPSEVEISESEIAYLCNAVNHYFEAPISRKDVKHSYSGVRALQLDEESNKPSAITRDYKLELFNHNQPAFLNIAGGKITTYRKLAEQAVDMLSPLFNSTKPAWTSLKPLSGGDFSELSVSAYTQKLKQSYPWLTSSLSNRLVSQYGCCCETILSGCETISDLGKHFGCEFYEKELLYLIKEEWTNSLEDILWRKTKLGLFFSDKETQNLKTYLKTLNSL